MSGKVPEALHRPAVRFLREQDGPPERELKERVAGYFVGSPSVLRAYLARVRYPGADDHGEHVALCIRLVSNGDDATVVRETSAIFADMFGSHEHLDIVFLDAAAERELGGVCAPFFGTLH